MTSSDPTSVSLTPVEREVLYKAAMDDLVDAMKRDEDLRKRLAKAMKKDGDVVLDQELVDSGRIKYAWLPERVQEVVKQPDSLPQPA